MKLDYFTLGYMITALWSSHDEEGNHLDSMHDIGDIAEETKQEMISDCADFQESNQELLEEAYKLYSPHSDFPSVECSAGMDFWLTRNGHGAGFWDRGFGELGEKLTDAAKVYSSYDLYIGDDNQVHGG